MAGQTFHLTREHDGLTLAAALRRFLPDRSWSQVRKLIAGRRVQVNGNLCLDEERQVKSGDVVSIIPSVAGGAPTSTDDRTGTDRSAPDRGVRVQADDLPQLTNDEIKRVLDLAAVAAHGSERIAAPVACWVGGRAGATLEELEAAADRVEAGRAPE